MKTVVRACSVILLVLSTHAAVAAGEEAAMRQLVMVHLERIGWADDKSRQLYLDQNLPLFLEHARSQGISTQEMQSMHGALLGLPVSEARAVKLRENIQLSAPSKSFTESGRDSESQALRIPRRPTSGAVPQHKSMQEPPPTTESSGSQGAGARRPMGCTGTLDEDAPDDGGECWDDQLASIPPEGDLVKDIKIAVGKVWSQICCLASGTCCPGDPGFDVDNAAPGSRG